MKLISETIGKINQHFRIWLENRFRPEQNQQNRGGIFMNSVVGIVQTVASFRKVVSSPIQLQTVIIFARMYDKFNAPGGDYTGVFHDHPHWCVTCWIESESGYGVFFLGSETLFPIIQRSRGAQHRLTISATHAPTCKIGSEIVCCTCWIRALLSLAMV